MVNKNKLGSYINELMMLAMQTQHAITHDLAIKELKAIAKDIYDFCNKENEKKEEAEKVLLQENKKWNQ